MTCPPCTHDCEQGKTCPAKSKDEIIAMAKQIYGDTGWTESSIIRIEALAKLVEEKATEKATEKANARANESWALMCKKMVGNMALAQASQEPVAWGVFEGNLHDMFFSQAEAEHMALLKGSHAEVRPLYTHPPQRTWVGLTEEDAIELLPVGDWEIESTLEFAKAIEDKLKERNT